MFTKRMSDRWMLDMNYAYNSAVDNFDSVQGYSATFDPTNLGIYNGQQYAVEAGGSGIDNVFVNAKHLFKVAGVYMAPWDINIGATYNFRNGLPVPAAHPVAQPHRRGRHGQPDPRAVRREPLRHASRWSTPASPSASLRPPQRRGQPRHLQRRQRQHRADAQPEPGGQHGQPGHRHRGAARAAPRRAGALLGRRTEDGGRRIEEEGGAEGSEEPSVLGPLVLTSLLRPRVLRPRSGTHPVRQWLTRALGG